MSVPSFFFSHARQDREAPSNYLIRFFEDLEYLLAQYAGVDLSDKKTHVSTIDKRIPQADDWDETLAEGLTNDRSLVAILTPLYFNRPNCGKELATFLLRDPGLGIDRNGALTGVKNVLPIRWLPESAYASTSVGDRIPAILRRIEDVPGDPGRDQERTDAIARYQKKGMQRCVTVEPHYSELLTLFVERIFNMLDLPPAAGVSFATALDAFRNDWAQHLQTRGVAQSAAPAAPASDVPLAPGALNSIVAFYVTRRAFDAQPAAVDFADRLLAEPLPGLPSNTDAELAALLGDVRAAASADGFTVFHAAGMPAVPTDPGPLAARLAALSQAGKVPLVIVDPAVVAATAPDAERAAVEALAASREWTGLVLLTALDAADDRNGMLEPRSLPPGVVVIPRNSEARVGALSRAFVEARGRVYRAGRERAQDADGLPLLRGVGAVRP